MGYPPLLLSDKISTSYLLLLLALQLLMPQSVCLLSCIRQVQQGHRLHTVPARCGDGLPAPRHARAGLGAGQLRSDSVLLRVSVKR